MDGSDSGTPNPLNPMFGSKEGTKVPSSNMPEMSTAPSAQTSPEEKAAAPRIKADSYGAVDPMMRSVARHHDRPVATPDNVARPAVEPNNTTVKPTTLTEETFDALSIDDGTIDMLAEDFVATNEEPPRTEVPQTPVASTNFNRPSGPDLVAKDSIVEPAGKDNHKKRTFLIGAFAFLAIALICGAAAVAVVMMNNNGDRVAKAIEKVFGGEMPTIVTAQGKIETSIATSDSTAVDSVSTTNTIIDFNGTFDTTSSMNKISADISFEYGADQVIPLAIEEMQNKTGDTYFKISGLTKAMNALTTNTPGSNTADTSNSSSTDTTTTTNCTAVVESSCQCIQAPCDCPDPDVINCIDGDGTATYTPTLSLISSFSGLFQAADNTWILISNDFAGSMEDLDLFDNSSVCLINTFSTLPKYSKDILSKYKANPFINSSTENLGIDKKANTLYRLTIDSNKLSAFANSLGNNGFVNELNACMGGAASNSGTTATMIEQIFGNFPTMYAEVDNDNNFTRFYFQKNSEDDSTSSATTADISLSYPKEFKIVEPTTYITMSQLLSGAMTDLLTNNTTN